MITPVVVHAYVRKGPSDVSNSDDNYVWLMVNGIVNQLMYSISVKQSIITLLGHTPLLYFSGFSINLIIAIYTN